MGIGSVTDLVEVLVSIPSRGFWFFEDTTSATASQATLLGYLRGECLLT